jgi:hypothetical protein
MQEIDFFMMAKEIACKEALFRNLFTD